MAKKLVDNFKDSKWVGPKVTLTPADKTGTPESFEALYEKRNAPSRRLAEPQPKLRPIENDSMADRLDEYGLNEEVR